MSKHQTLLSAHSSILSSRLVAFVWSLRRINRTLLHCFIVLFLNTLYSLRLAK